jgi:predicted nuclease of restriction endonuclease-like RecB superfamily
LVIVTLASGDPIFPSAEPRRFDSKVEERFARDFGRRLPGWTVVREPEPIQTGRHLVFPDFALHPRHEPGARWFVEIVGFWTAEYLAAKLERLRAARIPNLVLCIDEERNVGPSDLPSAVRVVRYRRRVDPRAVISAIRGELRRRGTPRRHLNRAAADDTGARSSDSYATVACVSWPARSRRPSSTAF